MNNYFVFLQHSSTPIVLGALFFLVMCTSNAYILDLKQAILNSDVNKVQRIVFVEKLSQEAQKEMRQLANQVYEQAKIESEKKSWKQIKNWYAVIGSVWLIDKGVFLLRVARWHSFTFYKDIINNQFGAEQIEYLPNIILSNIPDRLSFLGIAGSGIAAIGYGLWWMKSGITNAFVKGRYERAQLIRSHFDCKPSHIGRFAK